MRIFLSLVMLLISGVALSQQVEGLVTTAHPSTNEQTPLPGASVYWMNTSVGTTSDVDGSWKMEIPENGTSIIISYAGFRADTVAYTGQAFIETQLSAGEELQAAEIEAIVGSTQMSLLDPAIMQTLNEKELCKAACCNLSESFETNASIDASFTDAVTGTRQIQMLGLSGRYVQLMQDNVPAIRGLSTIYGLSHIPGAWISSIQIAKGTGSVTNGHESITGQINTTIKHSGNDEDKLHVNLFHNAARRSEANLIYHVDVSDRWSTSVLLHGMYREKRFDRNNDSFLDNPLQERVIARNSWHLSSPKVFGEYAFTYINVDELAGQVDYTASDDRTEPNLFWGFETHTERYFATAKTGFLFEGQPWKSIGTQFSYNRQLQRNIVNDGGYHGDQATFRANLLYASRISEEHLFTTGLSLRDDRYHEMFNGLSWDRDEAMAGAFLEYTFSRPEQLVIVGGIRADYNTLFEKVYVSPRLHARYSINENISLKAVAGKGVRSSAVIMENLGRLASNRTWKAEGAAVDNSFVFKPEEAINVGLSYNHKFRLNYRDASLSVDAYRTVFQEQVVVDVDRDSRQVVVYNLAGESYSNSAQVEFHWSPLRRFDVRMAYRWLDVQRDYQINESIQRLEVPMISKHRAFTNFAYETRKNERGGHWRWDATLQWIGQQRLPDTSNNPEEFQIAEQSDDYFLLNSQITWARSELFEIYLGSENILDFRQDSPILSADNPNGEFFDASMVWGPVFGRNAYAGLRWRIR